MAPVTLWAWFLVGWALVILIGVPSTLENKVRRKDRVRQIQRDRAATLAQRRPPERELLDPALPHQARREGEWQAVLEQQRREEDDDF